MPGDFLDSNVLIYTFTTDRRSRMAQQLLPDNCITSVQGLNERHELGVYDSLMIAAALAANSTILWSKDMQDDMIINGRLRIANPFAAP